MLSGVIDLTRETTETYGGTHATLNYETHKHITNIALDENTQPSLEEIREGYRMAQVLSRNGALNGSRIPSHGPPTTDQLPPMELPPMVLNFDTSHPRKKTATEQSAYSQQTLKRTFDGLLKGPQSNGRFVDYKLANEAARATERVNRNAAPRSDYLQNGRPAEHGDKRAEGRKSFSALFEAARRAEDSDEDNADVVDAQSGQDIDTLRRSMSSSSGVSGVRLLSNFREARSPTQPHHVPTAEPPVTLHPSDPRSARTTLSRETLNEDQDPAEINESGDASFPDGFQTPQPPGEDRDQHQTSLIEPGSGEHRQRPTPGLISRVAKRLLKDRHNGMRRMFEQNGSGIRQRQSPHIHRINKEWSGLPAGAEVIEIDVEPESAPQRKERRRVRQAGPKTDGTLTPALLAEKPKWANRPPCTKKGAPFTREEREKILELRLIHGLKAKEIATWFPGRSDAVITTIWNQTIKPKLKDYLTPDQIAKYMPQSEVDLMDRNSSETPKNNRGRSRNVMLDRAAPARDIQVEQSHSDHSQENTRRPRRAVKRPVDYYAKLQQRQEESDVLSDHEEPRNVRDHIYQSPAFQQSFDQSRRVSSERSQQRRVNHSRKRAPQPDPRPYLAFLERRALKQGLPDHSWDSRRLATWKGAPLHVDFSPAELDEVRSAVFSTLKVEDPSSGLDLSTLLRTATEDQLRLITWQIQKDDKLPRRTPHDIEAFLDDLGHASVNENPLRHRLGGGRAVNGPNRALLLRSRELGNNPVPTKTALQDDMLERLRPSTCFEKTSGDVGTVAWAPNGCKFAAGSMALVDQDSMQYNVPNNLLLGSTDDSYIQELAAHFVERKRTDKGPNSTHEMHTTQDKRLFTTVSHVDFSTDGTLMYSAGYDGAVRYWDVASTDAGLVGSIRHKSPVDLLSVKPARDGRDIQVIATGSQVPQNSIQVFSCEETYARNLVSFSSEQAVQKPQARIFPSALRWGVLPHLSDYLLAGFASNREEELQGSDTLGGVAMWDVGRQASIKVWPNTRNVFDLAWSPFGDVFAVACVAGNNRGDRRMKSEIKIYSSKAGPMYTPWKVLECPASDINDVVYSPYDPYLVSVGCTDGSVYIWDVRRDDNIYQQLSHGKPLQTLHYDNMREREKLDTGVRFTAWGHSRDRLCTGSSDGIVTLWNPYRAPEDARRRDLAQLDSGVMSGAFSPDYTKLLLGSVNGRIDILEVGSEHTTVRSSTQLRKVDAPDPSALSGAQPSASVDPNSGVACAKDLLRTQAIEFRPMGAFPIRQAVKGPQYDRCNLIDQAMDADDLRSKADNFQTSLRNQLLSLDRCTAKRCAEYSKGALITAEEAGDSGRSADRIPNALREARPTVKISRGMAECTKCGKPARPRSAEGVAVCESCSFSCLRCGGDAVVYTPRTSQVECSSCGGTWRVNVLGYEQLTAPIPSFASSETRKEPRWQRQSRRWAKGITAMETAIKQNENRNADDPTRYLTHEECEELSEQVSHIDEIYGRFVASVDENF